MICDPPKPRFIPGFLGKSASNDFHIRMLELPIKTIGLAGGGFVLSFASNAAISFSQFGLVGRMARTSISCGAVRQPARITEISNGKRNRNCAIPFRYHRADPLKS